MRIELWGSSTRRWRAVTRAVSCVAVVAAGLVSSPSHAMGGASAAGAAELTVDPPAGLTDGQHVTVAGTGFAPGSPVTVYQCKSAPVGLVDCDLGTATRATVDDEGAFSIRQQTFAVIYDWNNDAGTDCRVPPECVLATNIGFDGGASVVAAPISFDPEAALLPPPTLTVASGDLLVDGQTVTVEGRGFVHRQTDSLAPPQGRPRVALFQCGQGEWGPAGDCREGPTDTVEVDDDGHFEAEVPVSALLRGRYGESFDCRTAPDPCLLVATMGDLHPPQAAHAALAFDPGGGLAERPPPEISVSPDTDLRNFTEVSVRGRHFVPGATVWVAVCRIDDPELCSPAGASQQPWADARGELEVELPVWAREDPEGNGEFALDCRPAPGCQVRVIDGQRGVEATAPLAFGPPDEPRRYIDPVFPEVQVDRGILYRETVDASGDPVQLELDVYRPVGDTAPRRPAVMWMHGGFFIGGDRSEGERVATEYARRGYVAVSIDYRLRPGAFTWHDMYLASLDAYDDALAAVEWLQLHADDYGIDAGAISAAGYSAGAVTAVNLAYLPGQRGPATSPIAAAVPEAGLLYTAPERGEPPILAFQGTHDTITPYENISGVCEQAEAVDVACDLVTYAGGGHGASRYDIIERSTRFLSEHVLEPRG